MTQDNASDESATELEFDRDEVQDFSAPVVDICLHDCSVCVTQRSNFFEPPDDPRFPDHYPCPCPHPMCTRRSTTGPWTPTHCCQQCWLCWRASPTTPPSHWNCDCPGENRAASSDDPVMTEYIMAKMYAQLMDDTQERGVRAADVETLEEPGTIVLGDSGWSDSAVQTFPEGPAVWKCCRPQDHPDSYLHICRDCVQFQAQVDSWRRWHHYYPMLSCIQCQSSQLIILNCPGVWDHLCADSLYGLWINRRSSMGHLWCMPCRGFGRFSYPVWKVIGSNGKYRTRTHTRDMCSSVRTARAVDKRYRIDRFADEDTDICRNCVPSLQGSCAWCGGAPHIGAVEEQMCQIANGGSMLPDGTVLPFVGAEQ